MNSKVSILVPVYNAEKYVARCINSLLGQTYQNIEYVFVDDASQDSTLQVVEAIVNASTRRDACKIIRSEKNCGIVPTRNKCLDNATGDFFLFVDNDDYIDLDMVETMVTVAEQEDADLVGCQYVEEFGEGKRHVYDEHYPTGLIERMKAITRLDLKGVLWKVLFRMEMVRQHNLSFPIGTDYAEDYIFCCQTFYYARKIASVEKPFYHYVKYNTGCVTHTTTPKHINQQVKAMDIVELFYRDNGIYDELEEEVLTRKFVIKLPYLTEKNCFNPKAWRTLYPEANRAYHNVPMPTMLKLKVIIANTYLYPLLYLMS